MCDSDLQSSPVVSMVFGDILMMSATPLKNKHVIKELKILFGWGA